MACDFIKSLDAGCKKLGILLDADAKERLQVYFLELKKWSQKVNLIAKDTSDEDIVENHFVDSLALLRVLPEGAGLVDIGTGAGLPGLICKTARPDLKLYLVEPRAKRVSFLRHMVLKLGLKDVAIHCARVEDVPELAEDGGITHITSRAVSDIKGFVEMCAAFDSMSACRLCLKGPKWREELALAEGVLQEAGLSVKTVDEYQLPWSSASRAIITLHK